MKVPSVSNVKTASPVALAVKTRWTPGNNSKFITARNASQCSAWVVINRTRAALSPALGHPFPMQALHWLAFLLVMNLLLLSSVQRVFTAGSTGLAIFTLLTLGTFTAGVHILSWQICLLGLIMALGIPAIAWIENSALIVVLIVAGVLAIAAVFWWHWRADTHSQAGERRL